jgi:ribonuclease P protein component
MSSWSGLPSAAFPKGERLRRRADFVSVKERGARSHLRSFVVIRRASPTGETRLGITVSRRVGKAIVRNRVKRLIREIFRKRRRDVGTAQDILVIARAGADRLQYAQVAAELEPAFKSTGNA